MIRKGSDRLGEKLGVVVIKAFNSLGLLQKFTPVPTERVAAIMISVAKSGHSGVEIITM